MISQTVIKKASDIIIENIHPCKIILFGSYARGDATDDSDIEMGADTLSFLDEFGKKQKEV